MSLVWKLLRKHISISQFVGFFFANLFGMLIVLLGVQFYNDVIPVFTAGDSFLKADYIIVSKKMGMGNTLSGRTNTFSGAEISDFEQQKFVKNLGSFTTTEYRVSASMGIQGQRILNSELYFESVPDEFIDVPLKEWTYEEGSNEVPVILPRVYINMYNFGFAQTHSLPKISDGLMGMIDLEIFIHGNEHQDKFTGRVIGFSNRLNTILVPQTFMKWSNHHYAKTESQPTRLLVEVRNPADENITKYIERKGYDVETDKLDAEKTTYFLKMITMLVLGIGVVISALSFYILMLSIYLLVQKNSSKLENLLLIGYSPGKVALPYQLLTIVLNAVVLIITFILLMLLRNYYMGVIEMLFPQLEEGSLLPAAIAGGLIFILVTLINQVAIRQKVVNIWKRKEK